MKKEELEKFIKDGKSFNQISKETGKSLTTVRYWAKKNGLESKYVQFKYVEKKGVPTERICPKCKLLLPSEQFYKRRGVECSSTYCKVCTSNQSLNRMQKLKKQMVDYRGGCCQICGYDKYIGALEFHHTDPKQKDFNLSSLKRYSFNDIVKSELDKCVLVCANCHREVHAKIVVPPGFEPGIED